MLCCCWPVRPTRRLEALQEYALNVVSATVGVLGVAEYCKRGARVDGGMRDRTKQPTAPASEATHLRLGVALPEERPSAGAVVAHHHQIDGELGSRCREAVVVQRA